MAARTSPKRSATWGSIRPAGSGRRMVRVMSASLSRSRYMLRTFAAATMSTVPRSVKTVVLAPARTGASHRPPAVVKTTSMVMRGFTRATKSRTLAARG